MSLFYFLWDVLAVIGAFSVLLVIIAMLYHRANRKHRWHR